MKQIRADTKEMVGGCCVCSDESGWDENPLVYCDGEGCDVAVHQACYGIVTVPGGPWYCRKCESQERTARTRCELCPSRGGALKRTDTDSWAHVVCALYIPEVRFGDVATMEPILMSIVPNERFSKTCCLCEMNGRVSKASSGACMNCNKSGCRLSFHVTCAQLSGLLCEEQVHSMNNVTYCGYCPHHYAKLKRGHNLKAIPAFKPTHDPVTPDTSPEKRQPPAANARSERKKKPKGVWSPRSSAAVHTDSSNGSCPGSVEPDERQDRAPHRSAKPSSEGRDRLLHRLTESSLPAVDYNSHRSVESSSEGRDRPSNRPVESSSEGIDRPSHQPVESSSEGRDRPSHRPVESSEGRDRPSQQPVESSSEGCDRPSRPVESFEGWGRPSQRPVESSEGWSRPSQRPVESSSEECARPSQGADQLPPLRSVKTEPAGDGVDTDSSCLRFTTANFTETVVTPSRAVFGTPAAVSSEPAASAATGRDTPHLSFKAVAAVKQEPGETQLPPPASFCSATDTAPPPPPTSSPAAPVPAAAGAAQQHSPPPGVDSSGLKRPADAAADKEPRKRKPPGRPRKTPAAAAAEREEADAAVCPPADATWPSAPRPADAGCTGGGALERLNGLSAMHMIGNQLNPSSVMAEKLGDSLAQEVSEQADYLEPAGPLVGPAVPGRPAAPQPRLGGSVPSPCSLTELLERQWEQGSHFLMEQSQHFDIAGLLSCLYQLRQENHQMEERMATVTQRRDHLLAVHARLSVPLESAAPAAVSARAAAVPQYTNSVPATASVQRGSSPRSPLENGVSESGRYTARLSTSASPAGRTANGPTSRAGGLLYPPPSPMLSAIGVSVNAPGARASPVGLPPVGRAPPAGPLPTGRGPAVGPPQMGRAPPAGPPQTGPLGDRDQMRNQRLLEPVQVSGGVAGYPHYQRVSPPGRPPTADR